MDASDGASVGVDPWSLLSPGMQDWALGNMQPARKQGYAIQLTDEQMADMHPITLGRVIPAAERAARLAGEQAARLAEQHELLSQAPEVLHPVIRLHSPSDYGECQGCDGGPDYSGDWPCRTIEMVQAGL